VAAYMICKGIPLTRKNYLRENFGYLPKEDELGPELEAEFPRGPASAHRPPRAWG
jgi:hypothetical protein